MNFCNPHDADDAIGPEPHSSGRTIEALLRGRRLPVADDGFRDSVVVAMEEAALERRLMLAGGGGLLPQRIRSSGSSLNCWPGLLRRSSSASCHGGAEAGVESRRRRRPQRRS